jgi:carboxyl-terminal processing protease
MARPYSDILEAELCNGWSVGLSNQVYTNHRGENYEGRGLAPDVAVGEAYPSELELQNGRDDVLAAAVGLLSRAVISARQRL